MLKDYRNRMLDVYQEYSTFKQPKLADWKTTFKGKQSTRGGK